MYKGNLMFWIALLVGLVALVSKLCLTCTAVCSAYTVLGALLISTQAPGSQNGFDNSGRYGAINWQQGNTVPETITAIQSLKDRYASATDVVTAIELLNEPLGPALDLQGLKDFYNTGYQTVRSGNTDTVVVIHDAFEDISGYWNGFMNIASGDYNVMLDTHQYQIFDQSQVSQSPSQHVAAACGEGGKLASTDKWTVVGEWTGAQTE